MTIDDEELHGLWFVLESHFGRDLHLGTALIRNNPQGRSTVKGFAINHEYALFFSNSDEGDSVGRLDRSESQIKRYNELDEDGRRFLWENFRKTGTDSNKTDRPKQFYPIYYDGTHLRVPRMTWNDDTQEWDVLETHRVDERVFWPINDIDVKKVWKWGHDRVGLYPHHLKVDVGEGGELQVFRRNYLNERGSLPSTWWDHSKYAAGSYGTNLLTDLFGQGHRFPFPKSIHAVEDSIRIAHDEPSGIVLDYFAGSGTTAHAVINLNRSGSEYEYILIEMGEYFDTILRPRVLKAIYSTDWKDGKPVSRRGSSHFLKYLTLESYEDTLNNLRLRERSSAQQKLLDETPTLREDYLLSYCLDLETEESASLLDLDAFETPFDYQFTISQGGESRAATVDLPETFNYLLGLRVQLLRYSGGFHTIEGTDPDGKRVLVIWRSLRDPATSNEALEAFFTEQGYADRPPETAIDRYYVNGDNTLLNLRPEGATWDVLLTEQEFKRLMFADTTGGA